MNKYIAALGIVDENLGEEIPLKEISVTAKDQYEAHKIALFKCNLINKEAVLKVKDASTGIVRFNYKTGFSS
jgi:hypothetical protein